MKIISIICCLLISFATILVSSDITQETETVFIHGLNCSPKKLHDYYLPQHVIQKPASAVKLLNGKKSALGQGQDIEDIHTHLQLDPKKKYRAYCHSRGACAFINYMAQHNPENVQMIVLEAGPADMLNIVDEYQYKYGLFPFWTRAQKEYILRCNYPKYPQNSLPPVQVIPQIQNKKLPILIIHPQDDTRVNVRSAWQLYKAFKQAEFSDVYLCELKKGGHSKSADGPEGNIFKSALHSVYKKHGQSFSPDHATLQDTDLKKLQPTIDEIDEKLYWNQWKLRQQCIINTGIIAALALTAYTLPKRK